MTPWMGVGCDPFCRRIDSGCQFVPRRAKWRTRVRRELQHPPIDTGRDTVDWIVDIGGILGAFASLAAVIIALVALRLARREGRAVQARLEWETAVYKLEALRRIYALVVGIQNHLHDRNIVMAMTLHRELRVLMVTANLRVRLPRAAAIIDMEPRDSAAGNSIQIACFAAITEVQEALEDESERLEHGLANASG